MRRLALLVLLGASVARAHDADVIYVSLLPAPEADRFQVVATLTPATLGLLAPVDADGDQALSQADLDARRRAVELGFWDEVPLAAGGARCERLEAGASLREGFVELRAQVRCGEGELRQDFKILRVLPANYRVVLGSQLDGEAQGRGFAQGSLTTIVVPRPLPPGRWSPERFREAFAAGARRGLAPELLAALLGVLLGVGAWRRGAGFTGLALAGVGLGSVVDVGFWPPTLLVLLVTLGAASSQRPPWVLALLVGVSAGARGGGGSWSEVLGLACGTGLVFAAAAPLALGVGALLGRWPSALRVLRWVPLVVALVAVGLAARLSW